MTTSPEWSPWKDWHGGPCPCVGEYVQAQFDEPLPTWADSCEGRVVGDYTAEFIAREGSGWLHRHGFLHIIRYRIRRPRGLTILERILADLPAPVTVDDGQLETV